MDTGYQTGTAMRVRVTAETETVNNDTQITIAANGDYSGLRRSSAEGPSEPGTWAQSIV